MPVDGIRKNNPAGQTTAAIGEPFTYTLTFPDMAVVTDSGYVYTGGPDVEDIYHIEITDDLTAATDVDLTYVSDSAVLKNIDGSIIATHLINSGDNKHLSFSYTDNPALALIPAGTQLVLEFQVVLDDTEKNAPGKQFINTAHWELGRMINGTNYEPLPGQDGITQPMTIVGPDLVVTKTSTMPNINIGIQAPYTIDVHNTGGSDAWNTTITDNIPAGMCAYDPRSTVAAQIFASDGVTPVGEPLVNGTDYSVTWNGGSSSACQLSLQMLSDAAKIGSAQRLIINYQAMLDAGVSSGTFTNVAGATQWFSAASSDTGRHEYDRTLTNGTPGVMDFQDAYDITAAAQGYYFLKSVEDLTTGTYPAKGAFAGDTLRYTLQIQNFNIPPLNGITVIDDLGAQNGFPAFEPDSLTLVPAGTNLPAGTYTVDRTGAGIVRIHDLNLLSNEQYQIQFDVTLASNLTNGTHVLNQASLTGTDSNNIVWSGGSDDPYINGPVMLGTATNPIQADPTQVVIQTPGRPSKNSPTPSTATIGQQFSYRITVPETPVSVPLYDVKILDNLPANVSFVSVAKISGSGSWTPVNSGSDTNLVIQDTATGIDIPAGEQVVVEVTVKLLNTQTNVADLNFTNVASYTYNKIDGNATTQTPGGSSAAANMTVVEPNLTATKVASNVTPGKAPGDPITGGDIIQYVVTITNGGNATAYDVNVVDTLPSALSFYGSFVPTATINSSPVNGFIATPAGAPAGPLVWGRGNGDGFLDIPAGDSLVLTYRVQVIDSTAATFSNQAWIDWTSLNDVSADERTGDGCPNTTAPNNYCFGPASVTTTTTDNNNLTKAIVADTYVDAPSTANDKIVRIGDTATYRLTLNLGEGTTRSVKVQDVLPAGMAYDSLVSITPASGSSTFTYSIVLQPKAGATGTLAWDLGDVVNAPSNDGTPVDALVIEYKAKVLPDAGIAQAPTTSLTNTATLSYQDAGGNTVVDPNRLVASDTLTLQQPVLSVNKTASPAGGDNVVDPGEAVTYTVDIVNSGDAPAYDAVLVDTLPLGMRQGGVTTSSMTLVNAGTALPVLAPTYRANTGVATWEFDTGTANTYTIPARDTLRVVYQVTADADLGAGLILTNAATATLYYSFDDEAVPPNGSVRDRQAYGPTNTATTNLTTPLAGGPLKQNPANTTATIGQEFTYTITVPATPQPTALHDVRILDNLGAVSANLSLVSISKISGSQTWTPVNTGTATALVIEDTSAGIEVPANEQIVIGVTVRMNNVASNTDPRSFTNAVSYTYNKIDGNVTTQTLGGNSVTADMTLVEPDLTATKVASNVTPGKAAGDPITGGDIIQYVVTITNGGNATAYDVNVVDTLPSALSFYSSFTPTATINSSSVNGFIATPAGAPAGPLVWGRGNRDDGSLDIPAGDSLVLTYRVQVLESTVSTFSNQAWIDWTSLNDTNPYERTGDGCPNTTAPNNYCFGPASETSTTTDNNSLTKAIVADTYVDAPSTANDKIVRIGDTATYRLTLNLGEGTTRSVKIQDVLPAGMAYDSLVSITPASGSSTFTYSIVSQPAAGATGTLTWDLGDVVNAPSNDGTPVDALVIEYKAKVLRDSGIAQAPTTSLTNTATLSYKDAGGITVVDPTRLAASETLTLQQPVLSVTKTAAPAGGDNIVEAGEAVTYTVDIVNSGDAPAYDTVLVDTLPPGMRQGGVSVTSMTLVNAGTALPVLVPTYDANTGVATWNFDTGTANTFTIPAGETLRVVYQVTADADLGAGLILTNAATATLYYSFDDEAVPPNGSVSDRQTYGPTNAAQISLTSPKPGPLLKENTQPTAAIGVQFKYRITVPAAPVNTALHDVRILDDLSASGADLRFISVAKISGSGSWTPVNSGSDTNLVIEDTVNGIDIPANEQVVVEITVELLNTSKNVIGLDFTNTANYTYNQVDNTPASQTNGLPGTTEPMQIVGLIAQKTVSIAVDNNSNGLVDPGDVLLYTIDVNNLGAASVTGVVLTDDVPVDTTYVANSVTLNGQPLGDVGGNSPLTSGVAINSAGSASGTIAVGTSAVVTFKVQVNAGVTPGTIISNQGYVTSNEEPTLPTDADGNAANGYQPTTIVVGSAQQVMITKEVSVVGSGAALPGSELEYVVRVTNTGTTPTTNLVITDDLDDGNDQTSLAGQATYVAGSATFNGTMNGVSYTDSVITADYAATYGNLMPGATATLRFRVLINNGLAAGTRLTNTAKMAWNTPTLTATASVSIDIGGAIGTAILNGRVWHDANLDKDYGTGETNLANWTVSLYRNNALVATVTTDANGLYSFNSLDPTLTTTDRYELRFTAPAAGPNTASMGQGDSPFTNGPQRISDIIAPSGANLQNLNLPLWPNGAVYNSVQVDDSGRRTAVAGARLALLNAATRAPLPTQCFDDPVQQNQITAADGFYKFDLNFSNAACPVGGAYLIEVTPPATGYMNMPSQIIAPPQDNTATTPYSVPDCPDDAVPGDAYCEAAASAAPPPQSVSPDGIKYYLYLKLSNGTVPGQSQIFNNSIPIDPVLDGAVAITKTTPLINVTRGSLVPYTITLTNVYGSPLPPFSVLDRFPAGFKYVAGSARLDGKPVETNRTGRELTWIIPGLQVNQKSTIKLLLVVGSGVTEDEYVNRAYVIDPHGNTSAEATATVRVIPDPTFDCTDVIGKVFDDRNLNGYQDKGEKGLPGVSVVTVRGLIAKSDQNGRFHITCAAVPDEDRGSNFILKLDERTLPSGYRMTTENPRVERATRGKMLRFDFGATIHHVVRIDIADGVFKPNTTKLRLQWAPKITQLLEELKKAPSVLRLSYLADVERKGLVQDRLNALKKEIEGQWKQSGGGYRLTIETEIFWRRGKPMAGK